MPASASPLRKRKLVQLLSSLDLLVDELNLYSGILTGKLVKKVSVVNE